MGKILNVKENGKLIYDIRIESDYKALKDVFRELKTEGHRICIVSDTTISNFYMEEVVDIAKDYASVVETFTLTPGEEHKNLESVYQLYEYLIESKFDRKDFLDNYFSNWFGISNLPICLWSKLYKAELIKKASEITPIIVHFLAEDLIVTMNAVFIANKVTILPKPVYYYRPCGNTNRYMPTFLEDWSALYNYRCEFIEKNNLPISYRRTLDIEYGHMMIEYFLNLKRSKKFTDDEIKEKVKLVLESDELKTALSNEQIDFEIYIYLKLLKNGDIEEIFNEVKGRIKKKDFSSYIKNILRKFS